MENYLYVVLERDLDPYCGSHLHGVFSDREKAERYIDRLKKNTDYRVSDLWIAKTRLDAGISVNAKLNNP